MNKMCMAGRMANDPELRYTPSGVAVVTARIAVSRNYKNQETGQYDADFFTIVAWRERAEYMANNISKGDFVTIEARAQERKYQASDGTRRNVVEFVIENVNRISRPNGNGNGNGYHDDATDETADEGEYAAATDEG